jgi:D-3-phosphoglycerate dehydrogenase
MSRPCIISTSPVFGTVGAVSERLDQKGWQIETLAPPFSKGVLNHEEIRRGMMEKAEKVEFIIVGLTPVDAEFIDKARCLKGIHKHGVGLDNIDLSAASSRKVPVLNTPGANSNAVAELVLGGMIAFGRQIINCHRSVVEGGWKRHVGAEIMGKTLGIIGFGSIGRLLGQKANALGLRVLTNDITPDHTFAQAHGIKITNMEELLMTADFVSLHAFGGPGNSNLIGRKQIAMMKPGACLINLARGELVDLDAVSEALYENRLGGAIIDVYKKEPPDRRHPLFAHPRAVCLPHSGGDTQEAQERVGLFIIDDIQRILDEQKPDRVVNKEIYD